MKYLRWAVITQAVLAVTACDVNQASPITVVVYPSTARCSVMHDEREQPVPCREVAAYLRDTLKISAERQIDVSLPGSETVSKEDQSIDNLAALISTAGYKNVRTARFGL